MKYFVQFHSSCSNWLNCALSALVIIILFKWDFVDGKGFFFSQSPRPFVYALSATDLTQLAIQEEQIVASLDQYAADLQERLRLINEYRKDYADSSQKLLRDLPSEQMNEGAKATLIASHPLTAYRMVRRFAKPFSKLQEHIAEAKETEFLDSLSSLNLALPDESHHKETMEALLRLHYVYDLDVTSFSSGNISGVTTAVGLTPDQTYELANYAMENDYFTLAVDWLKATKAKLVSMDNSTASAREMQNCEVTMNDVQSTYKRNVDLHDRDYNFKKWQEKKYIFANRIRDEQNSTTMKAVHMKEYIRARPTLADPEPGTQFNFMALCQGANFQTPRERAFLHCWYETSVNPYWLIQPLKMELLHPDPPLLQIYEVIPSGWISQLTHAALPSLEKAPSSARATVRTATYSWLSDLEVPEGVPLSRRIELITGLNVRGYAAAEDLQIAAYAFGGHVATHVDSLPENPFDDIIQLKGNRVTTFLIYLNNVMRGGLTAFPLLGVAAKPEKGSAVLWYTSLRNGAVDRRMVHAACPVILGHKWIGTKWTHLNRNFLKRPCSLNPNI